MQREFNHPKQVLIFSKSDPIKAFVEFTDSENAAKARNLFNGKDLFNGVRSKANIFFSKKTLLMLEANSPNGKGTFNH